MKFEKLTRERCRNYIAQKLFEPKSDQGLSEKIPGKIGVELEAFPVHFSDKEKTNASTIQLIGEKLSLHQELEKISALSGGKFDPNQNGSLSPIRFTNGSSFQYEPGGQVEIATFPCDSLPELVNQLRFQQDLLDQITTEHQIHFAQLGTNPWFDSTQIGLQLDKPRYRALQEYFSRLSPFGVQMMRQTCSLHVNLDLGATESTQVKRMVAANLLAPFATAIFANSGILEGKITVRKSHRSYLWQQLDLKRTGFWMNLTASGIPEKSQVIDAYLDFVLQAPIIHIKALEDQVFYENITFEYWINNSIEGIYPSLDDLENQLSLLYPEVRVKGFLEIRTSDALPREWQLVPAFFYTGLLYCDEVLDQVLALLLPLGQEIHSLWEKGSFGYDSPVILDYAIKIMSLAQEGLRDLPEEFAGIEAPAKLWAFFEKYPAKGKTPAEEAIERFSSGNSLIY